MSFADWSTDSPSPLERARRISCSPSPTANGQAPHPPPSRPAGPIHEPWLVDVGPELPCALVGSKCLVRSNSGTPQGRKYDCSSSRGVPACLRPAPNRDSQARRRTSYSPTEVSGANRNGRWLVLAAPWRRFPTRARMSGRPAHITGIRSRDRQNDKSVEPKTSEPSSVVKRVGNRFHTCVPMGARPRIVGRWRSEAPALFDGEFLRTPHPSVIVVSGGRLGRRSPSGVDAWNIPSWSVSVLIV